MDNSYVEAMRDLAREGTVISKDGKTFSALEMRPVLYEPRPAPIAVGTLSALVTYLADNVDGIDTGKSIVHVKSPGSVELLSGLNGEDRKRDVFLRAESDGARFRFGEFMGSEAFIIGLNSLFVPTAERDRLLAYVSSLRIENESSVVDSGVSQEASVRIGVKGALTEMKALPSPISLKPYRTFVEVDQPESLFIFRMKASDGDAGLALFEADNGAWKREAMKNVAGWIGNELAAFHADHSAFVVPSIVY